MSIEKLSIERTLAVRATKRIQPIEKPSSSKQGFSWLLDNLVLGDVNIGTDLPELLYQTRLSAQSVEEVISEQIVSYIPEITQTPYELTVVFEQDPENYQEIMVISFKIDEFEIVNQIGSFL